MRELALCLALAVPAFAAASDPAPAVMEPRTRFNDDLERLGQRPGDAALREKIIALARRLKPAPVVPEEARRRFAVGSSLREKARQPGDYVPAIREYEAALLLAPWWGEAYSALADADEGAERFDDAAAALRLFLATKPKADDARQARDRLRRLEARRELKAAQDSMADQRAAAEVIAARHKTAAALEGSWKGDDGSVLTVRNLRGGEMDVRLRLPGPGAQEPCRATEIQVDPNRFKFKCTDTEDRVTAFDLALDPKGTLTGTRETKTPFRLLARDRAPMGPVAVSFHR